MLNMRQQPVPLRRGVARLGSQMCSIASCPYDLFFAIYPTALPHNGSAERSTSLVRHLHLAQNDVAAPGGAKGLCWARRAKPCFVELMPDRCNLVVQGYRARQDNSATTKGSNISVGKQLKQPRSLHYLLQNS